MSRDQPGSASQHLQRLFADGSLTGLSDGRLLERYLAHRDEPAFAALVERHAAMVLAVCRRSLADPGDLDDAFQATFLVLARRAWAVRQREVLGSWLFGVSRRVCLLANRAAARRRKHERRAAEQREGRAVTVIAHDEPGDLIYEEIERLPSAYRLPVILCFMQGRTRAEAALELRWSEGTVRGRLARARRLLRSRLIRRGIAPAAALTALTHEGLAAGTVPRGLIEGTARAAMHVATGRAAAGAVAATAATLSQGVIQVMLLKKLTLSATFLLGAIAVAWAATGAMVAGEDQNPPAVKQQPVAAVQGAPDPALPAGFRPLDDPGQAALHGRVVAPNGKPVAGARVWLNAPRGERLAEARTDAEGRFQFGPVEPFYRNRNALIIDADQFARLSIRREAVFAFPGLDRDLGNLQVDQGRVFKGQVVDFDGKPRPDATIEPTVYRKRLGHTVEDIGPGQMLTTDAAGRFRTPPLPVGRLSLAVHAPERQLSVASRLIRPGGEEEDLGQIRLEKDVPVPGVVKDEDGKPIPGVAIGGSVGHTATTDAEGQFVLHGFGPNPSFQMNVSKDGYELLIGRVAGTEAGLRYQARGDGNSKPTAPARELAVTLKRRRKGWIEGQAVDAASGEPVRLDKVMLWNLQPGPDGAALPRAYQSDLEQTEPGRFRASFPKPDEYRLTFSAAGYHDAEASTPKVTELKTIEGIIAKMKKKTAGSTPATAPQTIAGSVTRDGRPVKYGWVSLWGLLTPRNAVNAPVLHGRMAVAAPRIFRNAPIVNGSYSFEMPIQSADLYVVVDEPGHSLTQVGPIAVALNQNKTLDIACTEGSRIRGRVNGVPPGWEGHLWVIAFNKAAVREEASVAPDGTFSLPPLPAGEYGLKVGHDAYEDAEVYPGSIFRDHPEVFKETADPWKRAKVVTVEAGRETVGVDLELPVQ